MQRVVRAAMQHAAHRRDVGVVAAGGQRHVVLAGRAVVGGVQVRPVARAVGSPGRYTDTQACDASLPTRRGLPGGGSVSR